MQGNRPPGGEGSLTGDTLTAWCLVGKHWAKPQARSLQGPRGQTAALEQPSQHQPSCTSLPPGAGLPLGVHFAASPNIAQACDTGPPSPHTSLADREDFGATLPTSGLWLCLLTGSTGSW